MNDLETLIIRDSAGCLYRVLKAASPKLAPAHCYYGYRVVAVKGGYAPKAQAHRGSNAPRLIRKLGTTVVAS